MVIIGRPGYQNPKMFLVTQIYDGVGTLKYKMGAMLLLTKKSAEKAKSQLYRHIHAFQQKKYPSGWSY